jgi:hypothetical protein
MKNTLTETFWLILSRTRKGGLYRAAGVRMETIFQSTWQGKKGLGGYRQTHEICFNRRLELRIQIR